MEIQTLQQRTGKKKPEEKPKERWKNPRKYGKSQGKMENHSYASGGSGFSTVAAVVEW